MNRLIGRLPTNSRPTKAPMLPAPTDPPAAFSQMSCSFMCTRQCIGYLRASSAFGSETMRTLPVFGYVRDVCNAFARPVPLEGLELAPSCSVFAVLQC